MGHPVRAVMRYREAGAQVKRITGEMNGAFVAIPEIGRILGVSRRRVSKVVCTYDEFPKQVDREDFDSRR